MARVKGVEIPNEKNIKTSLTYIYGIGPALASKILDAVKVDGNKRTKDLSQDELSKIRDEVNKYVTEGDLRREVNMAIKNKMEIGSYQGLRHRKGLPVRGQHTSRKCKTRKGHGKTVANKKKA